SNADVFRPSDLATRLMVRASVASGPSHVLRRTAGKSARPGHTVAFPSRKMHTEQPYGSFLGKRYHVRLTLGSSESSYCCGSGEKNGCGGCRDQGLIILARLAGKG